MNRFGREDNYPDDIRQYDNDPRSPFYNPKSRVTEDDDYLYDQWKDRQMEEQEEQYQAEQDRRHDN